MKPRRIIRMNPDHPYTNPQWHFFSDPKTCGYYIICVTDNGGEVEVYLDFFEDGKWQSISEGMDDVVYAWCVFPLSESTTKRCKEFIAEMM